MTDQPKRMTEAEFDQLYDTANTGPLDLTLENLTSFIANHVWTQIEDENGQDWLCNGVVPGGCGFWISLRPWPDDLDDGDLAASWGGDAENPEPTVTVAAEPFGKDGER
jgi:hypothetical protein